MSAATTTAATEPEAPDTGVDARLDRVLSSGERPSPPSALSACVTYGWRGMLKIKHVPEPLLDVTVTPVLFLVMFTYLRPQAGLPGVVAAMLLVVTFAFGLSWVFTTVGLLLRAPNAVMNAGSMGLFPLISMSNIFVDPRTLPNSLEAFVNRNPISHLVTAARGLMAGTASAGDGWVVLATAVLLTAIFAPLTARLYRSR